MREYPNRTMQLSTVLLVLAAVLMLAGLVLLVVPIMRQVTEINQDEADYASLRQQVKAEGENQQYATQQATSLPTDLPMPALLPTAIPAEICSEPPLEAASKPADQTVAPSVRETAAPPLKTVAPIVPETEAPLSAEHKTASATIPPQAVADDTPLIDHAALQAKNEDYIAWLEIPGTPIDYPVVQSSQVEYYLSHTLDGKQSKLGTLLSLHSADYKAPGKNIAIYGHHLRTGEQMFSSLLRYKKPSYGTQHDTICLDSLFRRATYKVFAVVNLRVGDWEPATASFDSDEAFLDFVRSASEQSLYDTGVEVTAKDHILTLITCDRNYGGEDGRLVVMAVEQASKESEDEPNAEE